MEWFIRSKDWRLCAALLLLFSLLTGACGAEPTPTPPPPSEAVAAPTDTLSPPTDTPRPTDTPAPSDTPLPEPTATPEPVAVFEEAACPFDLPEGQVEGETVECGYLVVPEDRADPESPAIQLAVAIFRHPDGDPEPDPIFYLEGGPGGSPLEMIDLVFDQVYAPVFAANRDLILFDQRGVGFSKPALDCPAVVELETELLDNELDGEELTHPEMNDLLLETLLDCEEDLKAVADLSAYNTFANAADVDDLRRALGYDQVNLWGISYGTRLALEVMRDHADGVRSVVLDSVFPLEIDPFVQVPSNVDRALNVLFDACAADEVCSTAYPDLRTTFFDTMDRLNGAPASFEVTNPFSGERHDAILDGDSLLSLVVEFLYETDILPLLPQIIYNASQDNFDLVARLVGALLAVRDRLSDGMLYSVRCHDEIAFSSLDAFEAALADHPELTGIFEGAAGRMSYEACAEWDSGQPDAVENEAVVSDIPTLILSGEYDPVSPPAWGQQAARNLENGYSFEYPGVGHGASTVAGCPQEMMLAFLDDPAAAPDDTCIAGMAPPSFAVPTEPGAVELEPYLNEDMGIGGVIPTGWTEANLGVYTRAESAADATVLLAQAVPMSAQELLSLLSGQFGLDAPPEGVGQRQAGDLTWTLYAFPLQGMEIDMALTESSGLALLVLVQSDPAEHEALYEAVFLPVVDALAPLARPAVEAADAFMAALKEGDYAAAYDLCVPDLQAEFGSVEDLEAWAVDNVIEPLEWRFISRRASDDTVELAGNGTFSGDQEASLEVVLYQVDGEWLVAGFHVQ